MNELATGKGAAPVPGTQQVLKCSVGIQRDPSCLVPCSPFMEPSPDTQTLYPDIDNGACTGCELVTEDGLKTPNLESSPTCYEKLDDFGKIRPSMASVFHLQNENTIDSNIHSSYLHLHKLQLWVSTSMHLGQEYSILSIELLSKQV